MKIAEALESVESLLRRHLVLPDYGPETIALYIAQTYAVHEVGQFAPLLILRSPEMRSGKTTTMDLIGELVREPLAAANASPAALYRFMQDRQVTLLLDEVDAYLAQKTEQSEAVRGILNAGHRRGRYSVVIRSNERGELQTFDVFSPKVLSGIGRVASTLQDRAITLTLRRKLPSERVYRLRIARMAEQLEELKQSLSEAVEEILPDLEYADPLLPSELSDRAADNWELLAAIADVAGGKWPGIVRAASVHLEHQADSSESPKMQLLSDIAEFIAEHDQSIIPSAELVSYLSHCEHAPWPSWNHGKPITPQGVATLLREFQTEDGAPIKPAKISFGSTKIRGYRREWFDDAIRRYLGGTGSSPDTPGEGGTPEPEGDNSIPDNELGGFHPGTGFHPGRNHESEEYHPGRNPEPSRNHDNSLQDNELSEHGTGVPPYSGEHQEETEDTDPDPEATYGWLEDGSSPVGGRLVEYEIDQEDDGPDLDPDFDADGYPEDMY